MGEHVKGTVGNTTPNHISMMLGEAGAESGDLQNVKATAKQMHGFVYRVILLTTLDPINTCSMLFTFPK
jgi:hypothetical protein